jgi:hypothetical protein
MAASRLHLTRTILVLALAASAAMIATGQRRNFEATYAVTDAVETNDGIELTLTIAVHNFSGRDIENCALVLNGSDPQASPLGNLKEIKILADGREVTVRRRLTVPKGEFIRWQAGVHPSMEMLLPDGESGTIAERVTSRRESPIPEPAK